MSTLVTPKPPPVLAAKGEGKQKFFTLHFTNRVFTIQKNGTSIVSFRNKADAVRFGKILESHFEITHKWPEINFEDTIVTCVSKSNRLKYIQTKNWKERDLLEFCVLRGFSMLDIHKFEDDHRLIGQSLTWDYCPTEMCVDFLEKKLEEGEQFL